MVAPSQIELQAKTHQRRTVAFADRLSVRSWLAKGFTIGRYCRNKRAYPVFRPKLKQGRFCKLTDEQLAYADALEREYYAVRKRRKALPAELGLCAEAVRKAVQRYRELRGSRS